jgi:hypothetical protein
MAVLRFSHIAEEDSCSPRAALQDGHPADAAEVVRSYNPSHRNGDAICPAS